MDIAKNFAKATVSTGYNAVATSIDLTTGHGAKFPAAPFNVVWWNSTDYADPSEDPNVEIVRVTAISTDTLTVTRAQEGTSASTKNTGGKTYKMAEGPTADWFNNQIMPQVLTTRGDIVRRGPSGPERVALPTRASQFLSDGTDAVWKNGGNCIYLWDDWLADLAAGQTGWSAVTGGGAVTVRTGDNDHPGVVSLETSTSASAAPAMRKLANSVGLFNLGNGLIQVRAGILLRTALSDGTQTYTVRFGLSDSVTALPANGVFFEYSHSLNSGKWRGTATKASASVSVNDGGSAVALTTWYDLRIVVDATANQAEFFVNGTSIGTISSADLPTAKLGCFVGVIKSAGTTDRRVELDYYEFYKDLTNARYTS